MITICLHNSESLNGSPFTVHQRNNVFVNITDCHIQRDKFSSRTPLVHIIIFHFTGAFLVSHLEKGINCDKSRKHAGKEASNIRKENTSNTSQLVNFQVFLKSDLSKKSQTSWKGSIFRLEECGLW